MWGKGGAWKQGIVVEPFWKSLLRALGSAGSRQPLKPASPIAGSSRLRFAASLSF
jgi:hypothetical protein